MEHVNFNEFTPSNLEEWKAIATKELKGKSYEDVLVKFTEDNIPVEALYNSENSPKNEISLSEFPYTRGVKNDNSWKINEDIYFATPIEGNKKALKALAGGANSVTFIGEIFSNNDAEQLLNNIMLDIIDAYYVLNNEGYAFVSEYFAKNYEKINLTGGFLMEEISSKNLYQSPLFSYYNINGYSFNNNGATTVQEIALCLAKANELSHQLNQNGLNIDEASALIKFSLGCSPNYFEEIAKIRTLRTLWSNVVDAYKPQHACSRVAYIMNKTSSFYHAGLDINNNILRNTTQAMSAVLGGCNALTVSPHNFDDNNDFALRVARNIQLILQEEAYFNKVSDPSGGAYFVEYLTEQLCEKSWALFQAIETKGGFSSFQKNGDLDKLLNESLSLKKHAVEQKEKTVLGVNKHPNANDKTPINTNKNHLTSFLEKQTKAI
ncbi:MAG: methylmalonyl-CoA mutase family protein [Bacteroidia bacterium]